MVGQLRSAAAEPRVCVAAGTTLRFVNNDVMPHKLIQTGGPGAPRDASGYEQDGLDDTIKLTQKGVYRFTTKAGEDYKWAGSMKTSRGGQRPPTDGASQVVRRDVLAAGV